MKVLHLLSTDRFSGAENVVCQLIDMFRNEHEMVYCSLDGTIRKTLEDKNIKFLPLNKFNAKELSLAIEKFKPDVIHAHDVKASVLASLFHKKFKVISHIHGNDKKNMGKFTVKSFVYRFCSKRFKKIFWVSASCLNEFYFKKKVESRSAILHNIINVDKLYEMAEHDENDYSFDICYLGRLAEIKNPMKALEVMKSAIEKDHTIKCAIVGDGDLKADCENFIKAHGLENNIKMFGFVKNPYKILKSSKMLLMSSINEGTPMALIEAFAMGVPIVSTKVDGAVELIKNDKMGYLYDTVEEAVDCVFKIKNSNAEEIKQYLKEFSKNYNDIEKYKKEIMVSYSN